MPSLHIVTLVRDTQEQVILLCFVGYEKKLIELLFVTLLDK